MLKDFFGEVNLISQGVKELKDFTLTTYKKLIQGLLTNGYSFQALQDFIQQPKDKIVILRHDVDLAYRSQKSEIHRLRRSHGLGEKGQRSEVRRARARGRGRRAEV